MRFSVVVLYASVLVAGLAGSVRAEEGDVAAAASAFSRAQEAEVRGEMARAADLYELADRISPTPGALRSATRARKEAGQLASAAANAEELMRRYPSDPASVALADEVLATASAKLTRVSAECAPECTLIVDGLAASADARRAHVAYVETGPHTVVGRFADGSSASERVDGVAGQRLAVKLAKSEQPPVAAPLPSPAPVSPVGPPPPSSADAKSPSGWSPAVGLVLGGVALGLGGVAIWSALDTKSARDEFDANPTREAFDDGQGKDVRTNILIGASAVVGAASLGILAFATNWSGSGGGDHAIRGTVHVFASPHGTGLGMRGSF
jgi:hypothetical protein